MQDAADALGRDWAAPRLAVSFATRARRRCPGAALHEEHRNLHGRDRRHLPAVRGVRHRLQLRGQEHPRPHVPVPGQGSWGRDPDAVGGGAASSRSAALGGGLPTATGSPTSSRRRLARADALRQAADDHGDGAAGHPGAGTFGSTFLLLKNRSSFPLIGPALGTRFSGNGDLLTFVSAAEPPLDPAVGPVITSAIRMPDGNDDGGKSGRGFYVEDGGNPSFLSWVAETAGAPQAAARGRRRSWPSGWWPTCGATPGATSAPTSRSCSAADSGPRPRCRCWPWAATFPTA